VARFEDENEAPCESGREFVAPRHRGFLFSVNQLIRFSFGTRFLT
jgi:hypothetical protein